MNNVNYIGSSLLIMDLDSHVNPQKYKYSILQKLENLNINNNTNNIQNFNNNKIKFDNMNNNINNNPNPNLRSRNRINTKVIQKGNIQLPPIK